MRKFNVKRLFRGALIVVAVFVAASDPSPPMLIAVIAVIAEVSN